MSEVTVDGGGRQSGGRILYVGVLFKYLPLYTEAKVIGYFLLLVCCLIALVYFGRGILEGVDVLRDFHMHGTLFFIILFLFFTLTNS